MKADPVVVLGGGAAGLSAAHSLARAGREVVVLEREAAPGGLCRTFERSGYRFDLGGHRFLTQDPDLANDVADLLGDDLLEATRRSTILLGGRSFAYPLQPLDLARNLDPTLAVAGFASYVHQAFINRVAPPRGESFEDWASGRFGRTFYDLFFGPYTEKLWGIHPAHLAGDWASQRISLLDLADVALRLLRVRRDAVRTYARRYYYPRRGIGQIFETMTEDVRRHGGTVLLGAKVDGLVVHDGRVVEVQARLSEGSLNIRCDQIISTLALPDLGRMLFPASVPLTSSANRLGFRGVRFLNIMLDKEEVSPNTWMYVSEPRYLATRIQEPKHRSPESAPAGKTSLMLEIPCEVGGEVWSRPEGDLLERCLHDLDDLGIRVRKHVVDAFTSRITHGYPEFRLGYQHDRDRLLAAVDGVQNVQTCGRQGTFRYVFMDTAMEMGRAAARAAMGQPGADASKTIWLHDEPALREVATTIA